MIVLLAPSRHRPEGFRRMYESAISCAFVPPKVGVSLVLDDDDDYDLSWLQGGWLHVSKVERQTMSNYWNIAYDRRPQFYPLTDDIIYMMAADDMVFRTPGWDDMLREEFAKYPDRILMAYGEDGIQTDMAVFPCVHERWVKTVGRFCPPYFSGDMCDRWLTEVADEVGRKVRLPFVTEHIHPAAGKAPVDDTYQEKFDRMASDDPKALYESQEMAIERAWEVEMLRKVME